MSSIGPSWIRRTIGGRPVSTRNGRYWAGELVGTAVNDYITSEINSGGGAVIGTGHVVVSGQEASQQIFIPPPPCNKK
ncbi:MAG: hypothetical protein KC445_12010 [Anaerolineales bacterium]|nr:hypothetical protein [Anaerolineales bacterium]